MCSSSNQGGYIGEVHWGRSAWLFLVWSCIWSVREYLGDELSLDSKLVKLSQSDQLLQTIHHTHRERDCFYKPTAVSVCPEGLIYVCDSGNHRITVHDDEGKFLFAFGSEGNGSQHFSNPNDIAFGSDGLVYIADNDRVCVWSKGRHL